MLLGTLGASSLWNLLTGNVPLSAGEGIIRAGEDTVSAGQDFYANHPLTNFEMQYYQNQSNFNGERNRLPWIKDEA